MSDYKKIEDINALSDADVNKLWANIYGGSAPSNDERPVRMTLLDYLNPRSYIDPYNKYFVNTGQVIPQANNQQLQANNQVTPTVNKPPVVNQVPIENKDSNFKIGSLTDYIPNVFGQRNPLYEGLLGQDQSQALSRQSNIAGLLSAAASLSSNMGNQGPRRTAAQNIISALGAGYGAAGQQYQQGLQGYSQAQQLAAQQRQQAGLQAIKMKYPDLADEFDTNPAGAFRIVAEREAAARKPTGRVLSTEESQSLGLPTGVVYQQTSNGEIKPVEGATKTTGKVLTTQESSALGLPSGVVYQQTSTGEVKPVEGTGAKAPEVRDFNDGTTRQYDSSTQTWKVLARKPQGEGKSMYAGTPTTDPTTGKLVFLPTRPGLPVVDATTGKPVDYVGKPASKPMPAVLQKAEEEDFDNGQAAINLANDAQTYLNSITNKTIKFGTLTGPALKTRSALGSSDPDVIVRNDFERFKTTLINESLRLNKGTQTENDAIRAAKELESSESMADAGAAIQKLRDINARRAKDYQNSIIRRRTNAKAGEAEINLEAPQFEPYVFTAADLANVKSGQTYIDASTNKRYIRK